MELGAHVWLRKGDSHWGWVPAVITRKEPVQVSGVELINLTLNDDPNMEVTLPTPSSSHALLRSGSQYFAEEEAFEVIVTVDPEQLKTADHEDIKLRNLPTSFHLSGEDPEAGVIASPGTRVDSTVVGGVDDLIGLTHLHEPAILHALRLRYDADIIYTATGPILIAVNPFKRMDDIYNDSVMETYRVQGEEGTVKASTVTTPFKNRRAAGEVPSKRRLAPHVYQTSDDAYRAMMRGMENHELLGNPKTLRRGQSAVAAGQRNAPTNQSVLVSGESGAGKTVTTKIVLNYFAMLSKRRAETTRSTPSKSGSPAREGVSIEQQVLKSNPILESFGNARTIRNDNSSRFGKYIDIRFTRSGKLSGASVETYLLEKVRLIHPGLGERNYHVFYQFLAAATPRERRELYIGNMQYGDFRLLSQSGTYDRRDGVSDGTNHQEMLDAMSTMGFSPEIIRSLMRLVTGVLFAGNCTFTSSRDGESCRLDETDAALACAALLGISFEGLAASLTARVILAGDEIVHKPLTIEESTKALEALIKAVYGAMFDFIVETVNESIVDERATDGTASIGVLDIFGFETFETNSFEQLCINYTNEALQQQFNKYVFKLEQQEYEKEGIMWKFISFPDNQDVLDLIDKKHTGVLALLDEQCILPRSTDEKYTRYLYGRCDNHPRFNASSAQRVDHLFSIEHYAGYVEYNTDSWIEKNKDQLPAASSDLLKSSTFEFINEIQKFVRSEERAGRGTVATKSVSSQFSTQLRILRARIDETVPHYIRCLKPNDELASDYFEPKNVVEQLRCGGVLEAVRVSRAGYPTRYPHEVFLARYYILGDQRDETPQSPVFSPNSQTEKETHLKRLISKIAFDLWYNEHQLMQILLQVEKASRDPNGLQKFSQRLGVRSKTAKINAGPQAPPFNLVVESSVMTPEDQRRKRGKQDPTAAMRERRERHNVSRPESVSEFESLDFASRCAVAGLQLGRTKVFLRREAFDRIEGMRSDKFHFAASLIQKVVRGKLGVTHYMQMRQAVIIIQSTFRMKLSCYRAEGLRYLGAIVKIQNAWRGCSARIFMEEIVMARRYAAIVIQRAFRFHTMRTYQPSEDEIIRAIVSIQSMQRGSNVRKSLAEAARLERLAASTAHSVQSPVETIQQRQLTPVKAVQEDRAIMDHSEAAVLFREIQAENWAMVEAILDKAPELAEAIDRKTGELALHKIARHNGAWTLLIDMVLVLFPKALIHRDNMGALPMHHAAAHDNLAALEIIYSAYKEGVNESDKMGRLPIHVAANYDAVDTVKFLLSKSPEGAYTMVYRPPADSGGGLPLHIACTNHASIGVITALLAENFASAKRTDENGDLPLHLLLRCGEAVDPVVVKTLLTCFSSALSRTDMFGDLPIAIAIKYQCRAAVINAVLMQYPEAAGVLNGESHSPLFLAFEHNADDRTIMGLLNHAPEQATAIDRKTGLLPIQVATENEHSHFIVHNLLKRDLPIDTSEKVRAQLVPHRYSWNHVVSNTDDLYHQVVTKVLQSCTQPQVLALAHIEGPDGKIALASATPVCKHEIRVMLRLFNTLEVVNQRPAYTNPVSDTQIFYALRYDPPLHHNGQYTILHEEKKDGGENAYVEDFDDQSQVSAISRHSIRTTLTSRSQQNIDDKLRHIRKEKGQQVIAKLTSRSEVVERELKIRKDYHLSRHYVPAIISVHHTVQHAAYSEAMAEPGYCITMEGADTTAENMMLDLRKQGKRIPEKTLKRIGISLLHMHEHGIIHGDFGTHNIGKFGSRWKLLGVGGSVPIGGSTNPERGFYHPPESITVDNRRVVGGKKSAEASVVSITAQVTYDIWAYGVIVYEAIAGVPLTPYACRGKRAMTSLEVGKIGCWDEQSVRKALKHIPDDKVARDLLKSLLHHDPDKRINSMRHVLEHAFFNGGNLPSNRGGPMDQASPHTASSSPSANSRSTSTRDSTTRGGTKPNTNIDPPIIKAANSAESIENRENFTTRNGSGAKRVVIDAPSSPSNSMRSSRSLGGGLRKLRSSLRRQNA
jgi:myosin-5